MTITSEQAAKLLEGTTPGPWNVSGLTVKNDFMICAGNMYGVGQAWNLNGSSENEANAHLIAEAPDLARALIASEAARKLAEERLAKAVEALKPFAHCAKDREVDDPAWQDHISIGIGVTIGELRAVLSVLKEIDNG